MILRRKGIIPGLLSGGTPGIFPPLYQLFKLWNNKFVRSTKTITTTNTRNRKLNVEVSAQERAAYQISDLQRGIMGSILVENMVALLARISNT